MSWYRLARPVLFLDGVRMNEDLGAAMDILTKIPASDVKAIQAPISSMRPTRPMSKNSSPVRMQPPAFGLSSRSWRYFESLNRSGESSFDMSCMPWKSTEPSGICSPAP